MVDQRFSEWLTQQEGPGKRFTPEQKEWLTMIKEHIATPLSIGVDDFEDAPFYEPGPELDSGSIDLGISNLAMTINQLRLH